MSEAQTAETWRNSLAAKRPRVARALVGAAERRRLAASKWSPEGVRMAGMEQLLGHLDDILARLNETERGRIIGLLVRRAILEFETALESGLSGYTAVAHDSMRAVMEATDLILMFSTDGALVDKWLHTPRDSHWKIFGPSAVRRHLLRAGVKYTSKAATIDYQSHSMVLHVNPWTLPYGMGRRGISDNTPFIDDAPFWEIFSHGRELLFALERLRVEGGLDWGDLAAPSELTDVAAAFEKSKEMESVFFALMQAVASASGSGAEESNESGPAHEPPGSAD